MRASLATYSNPYANPDPESDPYLRGFLRGLRMGRSWDALTPTPEDLERAAAFLDSIGVERDGPVEAG